MRTIREPLIATLLCFCAAACSAQTYEEWVGSYGHYVREPDGRRTVMTRERFDAARNQSGAVKQVLSAEDPAVLRGDLKAGAESDGGPRRTVRLAQYAPPQSPYYYQPPQPAVYYLPCRRPTWVGDLLFGPFWVAYPQPQQPPLPPPPHSQQPQPQP